MPTNDPESSKLRDDVRLLGNMLGKILTQQSGQAFFDLVEQVRQASTRGRIDGQVRVNELRAVLDPLDNAQLLVVARAFSQFLNMTNLAEQRHKVRLFRQHKRYADDTGSTERLGDVIDRLLAQGITVEAVRQCLTSLSVELVMTAHPTEVTRRTLIRKYAWLVELLGDRERSDLSPEQQARLNEKIYQTILACWRTDEIRQERPTPLDEAKWGFSTVEQSLWQALPTLMRELDGVARSRLGGALDSGVRLVKFGSWMGGDRDGNPNVTANVTRQTLYLSRWMAADLYLRDINGLLADLSMMDASDELLAETGSSDEPYRVLLRRTRQRLTDTRRQMEVLLEGQTGRPDFVPVSTTELERDLLLVDRSLRVCNMAAIADGELKNTLWRVASFGATLLPLDIRQESARHTEVLTAITDYLGLGHYQDWDEHQRQAFLLEQLQSRRPLIDQRFHAHALCSDRVREVLDTCRMIAGQAPESLGAYVISMAQHASDILAVMLLQQVGGVEQPMRVVPLFETLDDLERAPQQMAELLAHDWYRAQVGQGLEVMIGYSDSAKDAGYLAAAWAQYRAQEGLTQVAQQAGVPLTLFHGRGGSISRGGSPTRVAVLSQPPGAVQGRIRVTEQGEVIRFKYGVPELAASNLEQYVASVLEATLCPPVSPQAEWREEMTRLTDVSRQRYQSVVKQDARLVAYLRTVTPEQELARFALGSRPARRKASGGVESLRAIPWVFAWTQMRLMLPAWLGTGEALAEALSDARRSECLRAMQRQWPFFRGMIDMQEMVLAKADLVIASYYESRLTDDPDLIVLGQNLHAGFDQARRMLGALTGHDDLLQDNLEARWSIAVRNPYTDPLHLLQAELMFRLRQNEKQGIADEQLERALMVTIAGIAAGLRNTG